MFVLIVPVLIGISTFFSSFLKESKYSRSSSKPAVDWYIMHSVNHRNDLIGSEAMSCRLLGILHNVISPFID